MSNKDLEIEHLKNQMNRYLAELGILAKRFDELRERISITEMDVADIRRGVNSE